MEGERPLGPEAIADVFSDSLQGGTSTQTGSHDVPKLTHTGLGIRSAAVGHQENC